MALSQVLSSLDSSLWVSLNQAPAFWKAIAFLGIWVGVWLPMAIPLAKVLKWQPGQAPTPAQKLGLMVPLYLLAPVILWVNSQLLGLPFSTYGWNLSGEFFLSFLVGMGIALVSLGIIFSIEGFWGWIRWDMPEKNSTLADSPKIFPLSLSVFVSTIALPLLMIALLVGGVEELVFRGFFLGQLQQDFPPLIAIFMTSGIFALLHLVWEQKETLPEIPGLMLMGITLAIAYSVDHQQIALAWGLHSGWVWGIATLDSAQLLHTTGKAPAWVTGLGGRPLAGVMGLLCMVGTGLFLGLIQSFLP